MIKIKSNNYIKKQKKSDKKNKVSIKKSETAMNDLICTCYKIK